MSAPFSGKPVVIGRSSGPLGSGSLTIASANAGAEASASAAPAVLITRRRDKRKREGSARAMAVPPAGFGLGEDVPQRRLAQCESAGHGAVIALSSEPGAFTAWQIEPPPCHQPSAR